MYVHYVKHFHAMSIINDRRKTAEEKTTAKWKIVRLHEDNCTDKKHCAPTEYGASGFYWKIQSVGIRVDIRVYVFVYKRDTFLLANIHNFSS